MVQMSSFTVLMTNMSVYVLSCRYDYNQKMVAMHTTTGGVRTENIYNFNTGQYITTDRDTSKCVVFFLL